MSLTQLLRNKIVYVIVNQTLLSIGSITIVVLLARFTEQIAFGNIRYLIAILAIFSFWSLPGISQIINLRASSMTRGSLVRLLTSQLVWGFGAFVGAVIIASIHFMYDQRDIAFAFIIGGLLAPVANLYLVPGLVLAGIHRFGLKAVIDTFVMASALLGVLYGVLTLGTLDGIVGAYLGAQAFATVAALICVIYLLPQEHTRPSTESHAESMEYGRQLTLLHIPSSLLPAIEKAVIYIMLGPIALALFVIAVLPIEHFKNAFRNLMQFYMLPHLHIESAQRLFNWILIASTIILLGVIALIVVILFVMPLLFPNFGNIQDLSLILTIALLPLPAYTLAVYWIAQKKIQALWIYAILAIVSNVVIFGMGTFFFELKGAVGAKILTEVFLALGLIVLNTTYRTTPSLLLNEGDLDKRS